MPRLLLSLIKNIILRKKMEMKQIYPKLPSAHPIDEGQGYLRLQKKKEKKIQTVLEGEIQKREALSKKYF